MAIMAGIQLVSGLVKNEQNRKIREQGEEMQARGQEQMDIADANMTQRIGARQEAYADMFNRVYGERPKNDMFSRSGYGFSSGSTQPAEEEEKFTVLKEGTVADKAWKKYKDKFAIDL